MAQTSQGAAIAAALTPPSTPAPAAAPAPQAMSLPERLAAAAKLWTEPAGAPAASPTPPIATPPATEAPALPSTPVAPATAAALAEQESASALIRQRNEIADARRAFEADRTKWQTEQAENQQRVTAMERAFAEFEADPAAFAKARGTKRPLSELARDLFLEDAELDKLPPEQAGPLRAQRDMQRMQREHRQLTERLQRSEQQAALAAYRSHLAAGINAVTDATPLVKSLAAADPQLLLGQLESIAGELALKNPGAGQQSTAQLAILLEPQLEKILEDTAKKFPSYFEKRFKPAAPPVPPPVVAPTPAPAVLAEPSLSGDLTPATRTEVRPISLEERLAAATRVWDHPSA